MSRAFELSFEFFPPRSESAEQQLINTLSELASLKPDFFSVTYGAGGSQQSLTSETVYQLQSLTDVALVPHMSCVASTPEMIERILIEHQQHNIKNLVVLRGDAPSGVVGDVGYFKYANELVHFIREKFVEQFKIYVAAYPDFHPRARNPVQDVKYFINKVKAGAHAAITQFFFNVDAYCFLRDDCLRHGVEIPLLPGIMPITNYAGLKRFAQLCDADIPLWLDKRLSHLADDKTALADYGLEVVSRLCQRLLAEGVPGFHFYTLNKAKPSQAIINTII